MYHLKKFNNYLNTPISSWNVPQRIAFDYFQSDDKNSFSTSQRLKIHKTVDNMVLVETILTLLHPVSTICELWRRSLWCQILMVPPLWYMEQDKYISYLAEADYLRSMDKFNKTSNFYLRGCSTHNINFQPQACTLSQNPSPALYELFSSSFLQFPNRNPTRIFQTWWW